MSDILLAEIVYWRKISSIAYIQLCMSTWASCHQSCTGRHLRHPLPFWCLWVYIIQYYISSLPWMCLKMCCPRLTVSMI